MVLYAEIVAVMKLFGLHPAVPHFQKYPLIAEWYMILVIGMVITSLFVYFVLVFGCAGEHSELMKEDQF